MALPSWTVELLRRGLGDTARKAREPETIEKIKTQATEILQELPQTAARGIDAVMRSAEAGKKSVERWTRKHTTLAIPMINGSGVLYTESGCGVPLADPILDAGCVLLAGDSVAGPAIRERLAKRIARVIPSGGDHSFVVTTNFHSALAAVSLLGEHHKLVVHRAHAVSLPGGMPLPQALSALRPGVPVVEVGSSNKIAEIDFDGLDNFLTVLADGGNQPVELFDLSQHSGCMQAVVLPVATIAASADSQIPSAEAILSAGADFVVVPGNGIVGGPVCGILIGRSESIQRIRSMDLWNALAADAATEAMMAVALEIADSAIDQLPIRSLIHTGEENLRGRAERMATRLRGDDSIASCQVTADDARLTSGGRWRFPSRQICVRHHGRSAQAWADMLAQESPAILSRVDGEELKVDLRWIAAADDSKIAEMLGSPAGP